MFSLAQLLGSRQLIGIERCVTSLHVQLVLAVSLSLALDDLVLQSVLDLVAHDHKFVHCAGDQSIVRATRFFFFRAHEHNKKKKFDEDGLTGEKEASLFYIPTTLPA